MRHFFIHHPKIPIMRIRAHHLFCMRGFKGKGYSPYFIRHMAFVITAIAKGESAEIISGLDEICAACPHASNGGCALYGSKADEMDTYVMSKLGLSPQTRHAAAELDDLITKASLSLNDIEPVCGGCKWAEDCDFYMHYKKE